MAIIDMGMNVRFLLFYEAIIIMIFCVFLLVVKLTNFGSSSLYYFYMHVQDDPKMIAHYGGNLSAIYGSVIFKGDSFCFTIHLLLTNPTWTFESIYTNCSFVIFPVIQSPRSIATSVIFQMVDVVGFITTYAIGIYHH